MKKQYQVEGMTCAACVAAVEKSVKKIDGVDNVEVNLLTKTMEVDFDDHKITDANIISAVSKAGYSATRKDEKKQKYQAEDTDLYIDELKDKSLRLKVSFPLLTLLMYVSMGGMFGLPMPNFLVGKENALLNIFIQLLITTPILIINHSYFITGLKALINKTPNMDSLIAIGSGASFLYGIYVIFMLIIGFRDQNMEIIHRFHHEVYFESAAMILTLITLGKFFETRSKRRTSNAITKLMDLAPKKARVVRDRKEIEISIDDIKIGDIAIIKPGERIPADGIVVSGTSSVDQAILTGESIPVTKGVGDEVYTATINNNGSINVEVTKSQEDSALAKIIELVKSASSSKAPIAKMADKIAGVFVPVVILLASITFFVWMALGAGFAFAMEMAVAVLVISCPCALGLATPVAIMVGTGKGASFGILIKSAEALEELGHINTVVLDKTGTITLGKPFVTDLISINTNEEELINLAYAMEEKSEHPLAEAIRKFAREEKTQSLEVKNFEAMPGIGIRGEINGKEYFAGNSRILGNLNISSKELENISKKLAEEGKTPMYFADEEKVLGIIAAADVVKPTSKEAIDYLQKKNIEVIMLTGDNETTAKAIAKEIGVSSVIADVLPENKEEAVSRVQEENKKVIMVGDGINDSPALARANIGIAIGAGTDIAIESADIVLMKNNLLDVVNAINLGKATLRNIKQNLFWAFFYNCLGIPIAAGVFYYTFGLKLSPMLAALAMSFSSVFVVTNALRLNNFRPIKTEKIDENSKKNYLANRQSISASFKKIKKEVIEITVEGMFCNHCSSRVEKLLNKLEGVNAKVDLENKLAHIESSIKYPNEKYKEIIEKAGYQVINIKYL